MYPLDPYIHISSGLQQVVAAAADGGVDLAEACRNYGARHVCWMLYTERGDTVAIRVVPAAERISR